MEFFSLRQRALDLMIRKEFDTLTEVENEELLDIINSDENNKELLHSVIHDREKLIDFITGYANAHFKGDPVKLEEAKENFLKGISKDYEINNEHSKLL